MILRRITKHVRDQNWLAVGLDFFIVVLGILIAFQITNWSEARQQSAELKRAEASIQTDLARNYYNAQERMALSDCRVNRIREISERLLEPGDDWQGMPFRQTDIAPSRTLAIDSVLRSPSRNWGSRVWRAELSRGTFSQMDQDRRESLDSLFFQAERVQILQDQIQMLQARLNILSQTTTISRPDRLRYYETLSEIDHNSAWIELMAEQLSSRIIDVGIESLDDQTRSEIQSFLSEDNESRIAIYGDCAKPVELFFLDAPDEQAAP